LRKLQNLGNSIIYIYISSSHRTCSRSRTLFREITEPLPLANGMLLASASLIYTRLPPFDAHHPSNSVSFLYYLAQFVAQQSLSLSQNAIRDKLGNRLLHSLIYTYPCRHHITPCHFLLRSKSLSAGISSTRLPLPSYGPPPLQYIAIDAGESHGRADPAWPLFPFFLVDALSVTFHCLRNHRHALSHRLMAAGLLEPSSPALQRGRACVAAPPACSRASPCSHCG
jgi:hypothetical protein